MSLRHRWTDIAGDIAVVIEDFSEMRLKGAEQERASRVLCGLEAIHRQLKGLSRKRKVHDAQDTNVSTSSMEGAGELPGKRDALREAPDDDHEASAAQGDERDQRTDASAGDCRSDEAVSANNEMGDTSFAHSGAVSQLRRRLALLQPVDADSRPGDRASRRPTL